MLCVTDFQLGNPAKIDQKYFLKVVSLRAFELASHRQRSAGQFIDAATRGQSWLSLHGSLQY